MKGQRAQKVVHGGTAIRAMKETGAPVLDFSASINPYPPQLDLQFLPGDFSHYPDDTYSDLKAMIARTMGRSPDEVCVGNGSIEVLRTFCLAMLSPGDRVAVTLPTFGEYEMSASLAGASLSGTGDVKVRFLCNPNNPTGHLLPRNHVCNLLEECEREGSILFLDEAFIEISDDPSQSLAPLRHPSLFVLRSLTKSFAIPGIRFGYGIGHPEIVRELEAFRPPWNVNTLAEKAAMEAFSRYDELEVSRRQIRQEREWLVQALSNLPVVIEPSRVNFLLVHTERDVTGLCRKLLSKGILVRDCHSFGLPKAIRVAVRKREENERLVDALWACMH
ncbi:MAG: histidinol-phosphate aminotransferase family protein [Methanolinea sp.]|nr:histidinol-phosphate aminotransferase family protein [Methanolinea sp.]